MPAKGYFELTEWVHMYYKSCFCSDKAWMCCWHDLPAQKPASVNDDFSLYLHPIGYLIQSNPCSVLKSPQTRRSTIQLSHPSPLRSMSGADGVPIIAEKPFHHSGRELVLGHTYPVHYGCGVEGRTALDYALGSTTIDV